MAKCDEGYLCDVCGEDVGAVTDSALYLRFVIGQIDPEVLHTARERHLRCDPALAQYVVAERFAPVACDGPFDKRSLDVGFVSAREELVTRGWRRLKQIAKLGGPITEYPLPEVVERLRRDAAE
ncbi:MAG: hypothetical protein ACRCT8_15470 [Lacipirellulaceae bacterium]